MMKKNWKVWTNREVKLLEKLRFDQYKTIKECAKILNRSFYSVEAKVTQLDLWRPSKYLAFLPVLKNPHSIKSAAEALGVKAYTIKKAKRELRKVGIELYTCPNTGVFKSIDPRRGKRCHLSSESDIKRT